MTSEAAQKAYPEPEWPDSFEAQTERVGKRVAFDRGAVEALRQAAANIKLYRVRENPEEWNSVFVLMDLATQQAREWLKAKSEDWEAGQ